MAAHKSVEVKGSPASSSSSAPTAPGGPTPGSPLPYDWIASVARVPLPDRSSIGHLSWHRNDGSGQAVGHTPTPVSTADCKSLLVVIGDKSGSMTVTDGFEGPNGVPTSSPLLQLQSAWYYDYD
jgi:hypothetical protein